MLDSRRAIVAAGVYENPLEPLNAAMEDYLDRVDYSIDTKVRKQQQTNADLYEEWKALFGKIDE